ncbi:hypothetical protein WBP07_28265 [Novosphingobium sp. BL-8A]|uniref:hypothetical protein n=1 Tax=Novosphingobium sp. BL-8A TaxID=3127639 RepID=UPI003757667E
MKFRFPTVLTGLPMTGLALTGLGALAGCTGTPPPAVATLGSLPPPGTLEFPGGTAPTEALGQEIAAQLVARGFTPADHGTYLAQITTSRVPGKAGLFVGNGNPDAEAQWLVAPSPSRSIGLRVATVTLSDRATGRELYRVIVSEQRRNGKPETDERIAQAVAGTLDNGAAPAATGAASR